VSGVLRDLGVTGALGDHASFVDTDAALESPRTGSSWPMLLATRSTARCLWIG